MMRNCIPLDRGIRASTYFRSHFYQFKNWFRYRTFFEKFNLYKETIWKIPLASIEIDVNFKTSLKWFKSICIIIWAQPFWFFSMLTHLMLDVDKDMTYIPSKCRWQWSLTGQRIKKKKNTYFCIFRWISIVQCHLPLDNNSIFVFRVIGNVYTTNQNIKIWLNIHQRVFFITSSKPIDESEHINN